MKNPQANNEGFDVLLSFFNEFNSAQDHHRSLVIIAHGYIDLFLNQIIEAKCKHGKKKITKNSRDYTLSVKLTLLNELDIINDDFFNVLDRFRKIRNRAAHQAIFQISEGDWEILNKGLDLFIAGESELKPNNLPHFCKLLIAAIWNSHIDILSKIDLK